MGAGEALARVAQRWVLWVLGAVAVVGVVIVLVVPSSVSAVEVVAEGEVAEADGGVTV